MSITAILIVTATMGPLEVNPTAHVAKAIKYPATRREDVFEIHVDIELGNWRNTELLPLAVEQIECRLFDFDQHGISGLFL